MSAVLVLAGEQVNQLTAAAVVVLVVLLVLALAVLGLVLIGRQR